MRPIVIINPNSTQAVTDGMDEAVVPLRVAGVPPLQCVTLREGPPGIETQEHIEAVVDPICDLVRRRERESSAFVIACYSDPGLDEVRRLTDKPVLGIAESAMLIAMTRGARFGIISILTDSLPRHERYVRSLGFESRCAGDRPIGLGVTELADEGHTLDRLVKVGTQLRDEDGADVLVMGCAGMARYQSRVEEAVGLPVIEPTQAAATLAIGAVLLDVTASGA